MTEGVGLKLEHLHHAYASGVVVDDLSLEIAPGELVCLLGPSGCGKTTTLRVIAGLERLQKGRISVEGRVLADGKNTDVPPEGRSASLLFQDFALFPHLTVRENVAFGLIHLGEAEQRERVSEVLEQVGMLNMADEFPHILSGGQQQRVALARARAPRPRVFLMDEPFSNLDVGLRNQIRDVVLHVLKNSNSSTLLVTHDPEEAMFMADRIAVMKDGRIEQIDTPHRLYCHPSSAYVAGIFTETNRLSGTVQNGLVRTPLGELAAPGLGDGTKVRILIRPEAISLGGDGEWKGRVLAARMLGASSIVHLSAGRSKEDSVHIHARIPGHRLPGDDELLPIVLDTSQAFIFPDPGDN